MAVATIKVNGALEGTTANVNLRGISVRYNGGEATFIHKNRDSKDFTIDVVIIGEDGLVVPAP